MKRMLPKRVAQYLRKLNDVRLIKSSALFDREWYLAHNADIPQGEADPLVHYLLHGGFEGRDPGPHFSSKWYLDTYQDVKKARINPLVHYLRHGRKEGRIPQPSIAKEPSLRSPDDQSVGTYKRNAWNSSTATNRYITNVEHYFFDAVTSSIYTEHINPTDKVLDVGAGSGRLSFAIADKGCEVVATDISQSMLGALEETKGARRITTFVADADKLPVEDAQFDAVVSMDFMFHFPNWRVFLKEQARVCKRGGHIIYNFYCGENLEAIGNDRIVEYISGGEFIAHCTRNELEKAGEELGLEIVQLRPYNFLAENGLYYPNLSSGEVATFLTLYRRILANEKVRNVVRDFEITIVKNLPLEYCARMVAVLRKS